MDAFSVFCILFYAFFCLYDLFFWLSRTVRFLCTNYSVLVVLLAPMDVVLLVYCLIVDELDSAAMFVSNTFCLCINLTSLLVYFVSAYDRISLQAQNTGKAHCSIYQHTA